LQKKYDFYWYYIKNFTDENFRKKVPVNTANAIHQ